MNEFWGWFNDYAAPKLLTRAITFRKMFEHLDKFENPVIVETGCVRYDEVWVSDAWAGDGCSTILFDKYISLNGGYLYSVDLDSDNVEYARTIVGKNSKVYCEDSISFLNYLVREDVCQSPIRLVYLDAGNSSSEVEVQVHQFNELMAIMPKITQDTLVVTDDSPLSLDETGKYIMGGRGGIINQYASEHGIEWEFAAYQAGWIGFPGTVNSYDDIVHKARKLVSEGRWVEAYPLYRKVYILRKSSSDNDTIKVCGEACAYFARMAAHTNKYGAAYDWYLRALLSDPFNTGYRLEMIIRAMKPLGLMDSARIEAIKATEISPQDPVVWNVLGEIEADLKDHKASLIAYSKFVEISNRSTLSLLSKVSSLIRNEQYEEAEILCNEVISRNEHLGPAFAYKAEVLANIDRHEEAIELYKKVLEFTDDSMIKHFLSLSLFSVGRHKEGWKYSFRARIENNTCEPLHLAMKRFINPMKQLFVMQSPPATVHIHADSGEGDNIAMMRYLPMLTKKGYKVRYEVGDNAFKIAKDSFPDIEVIHRAVDYPGMSGLPEFDYHLPISDLPFVFETDLDTIPWTGPYIKADPELVDKYKSCKGKIGIVWSTGLVDVPENRYSRRKSVSFKLLRPVIDINPSMFVSLQTGSARLEGYDGNCIVNDPIPKDERTLTWAITAAIIENLDLVIAIDTSVAHLAGAMGKPTWLMMHKYLTSWQFMCERPGASWNTSSPWYPSMRIFRQKVRGDWNHVVDTIATELKHRSLTQRVCDDTAA
jgi:tetratricopeptide (TPR) repeat protein